MKKNDGEVTIIVAGVALFVGLVIVGTLETVKPVLKSEQVRACVVSMGATTDYEINQALEECAQKYDYLINEEDRP